MALVDLQRVSKSFPLEGGVFRRQVGKIDAVKTVTFQIERGEVLALVGGSGCGKSTLAKLIAGLLVPDEGSLSWEGQALSSFSRLDRARKIQMIFQDPYASLNPKLSIGTQLDEVLTLTRPSGTLSHGERAYSRVPSPFREKVAEGRMRDASGLLEFVGLSPDALDHYPFQFSGGQRQRIAIARALAMKPELLVADEPLSALDVTTQAQILELLTRLKASQRLTILFITHDLAVASLVADRLLVLQEGAIVEEGPALSVLQSPRHAYTQALLNAVPVMPC